MTKRPRRGMSPDAIYDLPVLSDPRLSPDGRAIAFVVTHADRAGNQYRSSVWIAASDGRSAPWRLTAGSGRDQQPRWSHDGSRIAFVSDRDRPKSQLYVIAVDGGEARRLTDLREGLRDPDWSPNDTMIAFASTVPGRAYDEEDVRNRQPRRITKLRSRTDAEGWELDRPSHIFIVGADGADEPTRVTQGDAGFATPRWSPDGQWIALTAAVQPDADLGLGRDLHLLEVATRGMRQVTDGAAQCGSPAWSADGQRIACRSFAFGDPQPAHTQIAVIDVGSGRVEVLTAALDLQCGPPFETREPVWTGDRLLFPVERRGATQLLEMAADGSSPPIPVVDGEGVVAGHDAVAGTVAYLWTTATEPAELFCGGKRLTSFTEPFMELTTLSAPEQFSVRTADDAEVDAWIMRPVDFVPGTRYPTLLFVHGGPFTQYRHAFFDEFQVAAAAGYAVIYSNPRGSSGYGEPWGRAIRGPIDGGRGFGGVDADDLCAVVDAAIETFDFCDPKRVGLLGGSYGGFMTAWLVSHTDRFRAACAERGVFNWLSFFGTSDLGDLFAGYWGGLPYEHIEAMTARSPIAHVASINAPMLIVHYEDDRRAPVSQSEELFTALRLLQKPVEFVRFQSGNHDLSRDGLPRHRVNRFEIILEWFGEHLRATPAEEPADDPAGSVETTTLTRTTT